jgi:hypothetical protein
MRAKGDDNVAVQVKHQWGPSKLTSLPPPILLTFNLKSETSIKDIIRHLSMGILVDDVPFWVVGPKF